LQKHTPAVSTLKRRFCDNGTMCCPPTAFRRRVFHCAIRNSIF
jgi:hypothetical protein